mmetsp:Transcript_1946/g.6518  ORF Transcript_1946/g.6518 Transcript_1946/m.6518 type:complete len:268 (-) Transcript_1946:1907-2710(-)
MAGDPVLRHPWALPVSVVHHGGQHRRPADVQAGIQAAKRAALPPLRPASVRPPRGGLLGSGPAHLHGLPAPQPHERVRIGRHRGERGGQRGRGAIPGDQVAGARFAPHHAGLGGLGELLDRHHPRRRCVRISAVHGSGEHDLQRHFAEGPAPGDGPPKDAAHTLHPLRAVWGHDEVHDHPGRRLCLPLVPARQLLLQLPGHPALQPCHALPALPAADGAAAALHSAHVLHEARPGAPDRRGGPPHSQTVLLSVVSTRQRLKVVGIID